MEWVFNGFVLNSDRAELIGPNGPVHVEKHPLDLLIFLARNADRVVTREEIISGVWNGQIVSDAAISTAIKQARKAVGDTGAAQEIIRTLHGRGFRFVAELTNTKAQMQPAQPENPAEPNPTRHPEQTIGQGRPSLAVLRFQQMGGEGSFLTIADALPAEIIASLSRVRWMHIISRGSSFRFDPVTFDPTDVGNLLGVRYLMSGTVEVIGEMLTISIEILSCANGTQIWSDRYAARIDEIQLARQNIVGSVIAALELVIPQIEAAESRRLEIHQFDAWSHFHLGLSHIYKFNQGDNLIAEQHFEAALALDPHFARAHSGLSFTNWQNAFMQFGEDRRQLVVEATNAASRALDIDATDPFANFNMGRARWLEGDIDGCQIWLDRALQVNPNFAQCHYNKGLILTLEGASPDAIEAVTTAQALSPLDPLLYGMHGARALSYIDQDDFEKACQFAERAMQSPGAHFYIALIAAVAFELKEDRATALKWRDFALTRRPDASLSMFLEAFPFRTQAMNKKVSGAFNRLGLAS